MGLGMASMVHRWSVGGVGGQAVGLAAGVCLGMVRVALSALVGCAGQRQL